MYFKVKVYFDQYERYRILIILAASKAEAIVKTEMQMQNSGKESFVVQEAEEIQPDKYGVIYWVGDIYE